MLNGVGDDIGMCVFDEVSGGLRDRAIGQLTCLLYAREFRRRFKGKSCTP